MTAFVRFSYLYFEQILRKQAVDKNFAILYILPLKNIEISSSRMFEAASTRDHVNCCRGSQLCADVALA